MEHNEMSINDSKIEFIEDGQLTDLAGGWAKKVMVERITCRSLSLRGNYSQAAKWAASPACRPFATLLYVKDAT